jgi:hypothetical protein
VNQFHFISPLIEIDVVFRASVPYLSPMPWDWS